MNLLRRKFVKTAAFVGATVSLGSSALLVPQRALAAYDKAAFEATDVNGVLNEVFGSTQHSASDAINVKAPDIAENGAVVPVTVSSDMSNVDMIAIMATGNNVPLTSTYMLSANAEPFVSTRIKMAKTADVIAVVKADGKLFSATKEVKVTIGGCGG